MLPKNCIYRFQPWRDFEYYECKCSTKVTEHGLISMKCSEEICPVIKECKVEIPAALEPLLEYYQRTIDELKHEINDLKRRTDNLEWKQKNDETNLY